MAFSVLGGGNLVLAQKIVTDKLTKSDLKATSTSYVAFSNVKKSSSAIYAGNSAGDKNSIQLRSSNNNSGIVTTTSGGFARKIAVTWNSGTASGRTLNIYGKNSAYSAATDLYDTTNQGTLLGTIVYGTSTELALEDDYEYIGLRSNSGAMYLTDISIDWETSGYTFEFSATEANAVIGSEFTAPTLTNTYEEGTMAWDSSVKQVATVNENGDVAIIGAGTTTISATLTLPDSKPITASYTLTVKEPAAGECTYKKVKSVDEIVDGGIYIIVNETKQKAMGTIANNKGQGIDVTIQNGLCTASSDVEITLEQQDNGYALKNAAGYIAYSGSSTNFNSKETVSDDNCKWTITLTTQGNAEIKNVKAQTRFIRFYDTASDFRAYTSSNGTVVQIYKKIESMTITSDGKDETDGKYYATYFTNKPFMIPADVTCATVSVKDNKLSVTKYNTGDIVPAYTGLLISSAEAGTYDYGVLAKGGTTHADNMLKGFTTEDTTEGEGCVFYRLAKPAGKNLGFWYGAENGAAFRIGANKAYLAVPADVAAELTGFAFADAENATGISHTAGQTDDAPTTVYNLNGQRIDRITQPGIYIVNGKKKLVK
ncbi:MAG: hypothetical protein NC388_10220 [Clostridium sp.]|nr:hypothetical protein [Clostridium sp.]